MFSSLKDWVHGSFFLFATLSIASSIIWKQTNGIFEGWVYWSRLSLQQVARNNPHDQEVLGQKEFWRLPRIQVVNLASLFLPVYVLTDFWLHLFLLPTGFFHWQEEGTIATNKGSFMPSQLGKHRRKWRFISLSCYMKSIKNPAL